jgi:hypothetical protein
VICVRYSTLLDTVFAASTRYHQALERLSRLAGRGRPDLFRKAMLDCETCARGCRRAVAAFNAHQSDHGCQAPTDFVLRLPKAAVGKKTDRVAMLASG